jgi:competence protein ComEA
MENMPELPLSRRSILVGAAALVVLLALGGRTLLARDPAAPALTTALRASAPAGGAARPPLLVHVVGAVRRPGLYRLHEGARVADALERAAGPGRRADLSLVNLAAPVSDGQQIVVPRRLPGGAAAGAGLAAPGGPVHLNTATLEQLDELPGVGPVTAQKILDYRQEHGAFASVDELDAIPSTGPARLEQLRELVAP